MNERRQTGTAATGNVATVRKGLEGWCSLCFQPISQHFAITDRGMAWLGCAEASSDIGFFLIPDRRGSGPEESDIVFSRRRAMAAIQAAAIATQPKATEAATAVNRKAALKAAMEPTNGPVKVSRNGVPPKSATTRLTGVLVYSALTAGRKKLDKLTPTQLECYDALANDGGPMPVVRIAQVSKHPTETTRVALNILTKLKLVKRSKT